LESIFLAIDSRESATKRVKVLVHNDPLFTGFLIAALLSLSFYFLARKLFLKEIL
jgi:uncharacterized membrane protein